MLEKLVMSSMRQTPKWQKTLWIVYWKKEACETLREWRKERISKGIVYEATLFHVAKEQTHTESIVHELHKDQLTLL